jgi:hypothetical protein
LENGDETGEIRNEQMEQSYKVQKVDDPKWLFWNMAELCAMADLP